MKTEEISTLQYLLDNMKMFDERHSDVVVASPYIKSEGLTMYRFVMKARVSSHDDEWEYSTCKEYFSCPNKSPNCNYQLRKYYSDYDLAYIDLEKRTKADMGKQEFDCNENSNYQKFHSSILYGTGIKPEYKGLGLDEYMSILNSM
tara:strand:+ start:284 stop:721 length:438 start_codon:yes stop_codon:yes gene_type:complete